MRYEHIPWTAIEESSNVDAVAYDGSHTVCVRFRNGGLYTYLGPNEEIYMGLIHAPSVGRYLHRVLKQFPYTRWESEDELLNHLNIA